jgi:F-type H+-transporting ATPase subunit b
MLSRANESSTKDDPMTPATSNFLVPNGTFIVVLIAFIIVVAIITKYVVPPLNAALAERQEKIRSELEAADKARLEAEEADVERQRVLDEARAHAREIVSQANTTAERTVASAEQRANEAADRIMAAAEVEVAAARQTAVDQVTAQVGELVMAAAERVVGREIRAADHQDLIDEAIAAIRSEATTGASAGAGGGSQ